MLIPSIIIIIVILATFHYAYTLGYSDAYQEIEEKTQKEH